MLDLPHRIASTQWKMQACARLHPRATMLNTASWTYEASSDTKPRLSEHEPARFPNVGSKFALGCRGRALCFLCETRRRIETRPRVLSCSLRRHVPPRSTCVRSLLPTRVNNLTDRPEMQSK